MKALLSHLSNHRSVLAVLLQKCREGGPEAPSNFGSMKKFIFRVLTLQFSVCLTQCFYVETFETNIFRLNYVVSFCWPKQYWYFILNIFYRRQQRNFSADLAIKIAEEISASWREMSAKMFMRTICVLSTRNLFMSVLRNSGFHVTKIHFYQK